MMSWKSIISSVAPTIATALGGPLAGLAAREATKALFGDEVIAESDMETRIQDAISADPQALLKLKLADQKFKEKMKSLDVDLEGIHTADRSSARDLAKNTSMKPQIALATLYNAGFILIIYAVFFSDLKLEGTQKDIALYLLGILSAGLVQMNNFFFGSSSGSKTKTDKMAMK